jgi:hypothetical protein
MANLLYGENDLDGKKSQYLNEWQTLMNNRNNQMIEIRIKDAEEFELINKDNIYINSYGVYVPAI